MRVILFVLFIKPFRIFFKEIPISIRPLKDCSIDLGDYDKDGDLDIIMTGESLERPYTIVYNNNLGLLIFVNIYAGLTGS